LTLVGKFLQSALLAAEPAGEENLIALDEMDWRFGRVIFWRGHR
jgi:hypothetical protein